MLTQIRYGTSNAAAPLDIFPNFRMVARIDPQRSKIVAIPANGERRLKNAKDQSTLTIS
jgi:hypothetical protein